MTAHDQPSPNRLYRDPAGGYCLGVCAGLADYFGVSTASIRVAAVFGLVFFTVPTVIGYLAAGYFLEPKPDGLYSSGEEETSWRQGRLDPSRMALDLRHKFRDIERRIREAEAYVTSSEFKLKRDFDEL